MSSFWKEKKVLVTGGTGFIGSHVVKELVKRGAVVTVSTSKRVASNEVSKVLSEVKEKITIVAADLLSVEDCLKVTEGQDIVLNFAAVDGGKQFKLENSEFIFRVNTKIVLNLLQSAKQNNVKRFLITSSIEVYSLSSQKNLTEDTNFLFNWKKKLDGYIWSKIVSEISARMYAEDKFMKVGIVRLGNIYGPHDTTGVEKGRVIPTFIHKALRNEDIIILGSGMQEKPFLFIDDAVQGVLTFMEKLPTSQPINIVGKKYTTIKDLALFIKSLINSSSRIVHLDNEYQITTKRISANKATELIGFTEKVSLKDGLKKTIGQESK